MDIWARPTSKLLVECTALVLWLKHIDIPSGLYHSMFSDTLGAPSWLIWTGEQGASCGHSTFLGSLRLSAGHLNYNRYTYRTLRVFSLLATLDQVRTIQTAPNPFSDHRACSKVCGICSSPVNSSFMCGDDLYLAHPSRRLATPWGATGEHNLFTPAL